MGRFKNKTAVITGAGSGVGRSIALRFAEEGADIGLLDVNEHGLKGTAERLQALSMKAVICKCDMSEISDIDAAVKVIFEEFKKIVILVNGAGIGDTNASYEDLEPELWDKVYGVNVKGLFS